MPKEIKLYFHLHPAFEVNKHSVENAEKILHTIPAQCKNLTPPGCFYIVDEEVAKPMLTLGNGSWCPI
jgi:hypothetical protein